jgi:hypothetical protein
MEQLISHATDAEGGRESPVRRFLVSMILIGAVGWAAYVLSREPEPPGPQNLIEVSAANTEVKPVLATSSPAEIEGYIRQTYGVEVRLPYVDGAEISAAGPLPVQQGISVPTIVFVDPEGDISRMLVFTYSLLDDWSLGLYLDRSVRLELEHDGSYAVVATEDNREAVLWRSRDDIFLAIAERGAGRLIPRIRTL